MKTNISKCFKRWSSYFFYYSGLTTLLHDSYKNNIILGYHRVLPDKHEDINHLQPGMYVTTKTFEKHLKFIKDHYSIIPLENLKNNFKKKNCCIITFDDGWKDNYDYAYPILKKYTSPATIFLSTGKIGTKQWHWSDKLSFYVHKLPDDDLVTFLATIRNYMSEFLKYYFSKKISINKRYEIVEYLVSLIKELDIKKISLLMKKIDSKFSSILNINNMPRLWLTWQEISEMSENSISFGAHTHNHVILTNLSKNDAIKEIVTSKDILSKRLNKTIDMFSYPNGNYNEEIKKILKYHKFKISLTTRRGVIEDSEDMLTLKRFILHDDMTNTTSSFACRLMNKLWF